VLVGRAEHQDGVRAAEPEGVGQAVTRAELARLIGDDVEVHLRVDATEAGHRRREPLAQRPQGHDGLDGTGPADHVPGGPLRCGHRRRRTSEEL